MKLMAFSVRDNVAGVFSRPYFVPNAPTAIRAFADTVRRPDEGIFGHEGDFDLYKLGEFDDVTGVYEGVVPPVFLAHASDFKVEVKGENR